MEINRLEGIIESILFTMGAKPIGRRAEIEIHAGMSQPILYAISVSNMTIGTLRT